MRLHLACIGRLKAGPERLLFERYAERIAKAGRGIALGPLSVIERPESRASRASDRKAEEAQTLLNALPGGAVVIALDETGRPRSSSAFSDDLAAWRDAGVADLAFVIGGADGHGAALINAARATLALGPMTWPHQFARFLVAEQIYRAVTILSGHPYHRS